MAIELGGGMMLVSDSTGHPVSFAQNFEPYRLYSLHKSAFYVSEGLIQDALIPLKLMRMEDIRQLQILSTVRVDGRFNPGKGPHTFPHNRLIHNLRAGALHGIIGKACGLNREDLAVGILADCMHDNFTCAGGDSWKDIDHQKTLFDEDEDFAGKIFRYCGDGWRWLCSKYGFNPESTAQTLQEIVYGHGLRGEIHEIADTASYMLGDLEEIRRVCWNKKNNTPDFAEILNFAKRPWDIWNHLMEKDGHIVVTNPITLNNFLALRVMLWANLYQSPNRKVLEVLLRDIVYPYMVDKKQIKISDLPTKTDTWLFEKVEREMGWQKGQSTYLNLLGSFPNLKAFTSWNWALAFEAEKYKAGNFTMVFSVQDFQRTNSKTNKYNVLGRDGSVETFKTAYPDHAAVIDEIAVNTLNPLLPVQVMYVEHPRLSDNFRKAWDVARAGWKKKK